MAIKITSNIIPAGDTPNPNAWTHEDIYGKGGFVAIITTVDLPEINDHITPARRKEGMLVYDVTTNKYWRCLSAVTDTDDNNWVEENFGGSSISITGGLGIDVTPDGSNYTIGLNASLEDLSNVSIDQTIAPDQVLAWDGNNWIAKSITITAEGTDGMVASATAPFLLWTPDGSLPDAKTLIGDGIIGIDNENTDNTVLLYIENESITLDKIAFNTTISGVPLGSNLYGLTFGTGLYAGIFDDYDGSSAVKLDIDFGLGINQVARGNHTHTLDQLEDVAITNATEGDVVVYSGTEGWVNRNFIYGGSASSFA